MTFGDLLRGAEADERRAREALEATEIAVPVDRKEEDARDADASEERAPPLRQVLLPVDGTAQSEYMVDWALANFCREGDQVNILHVIPK